MRKQYSFWPGDEGLDAWDVHRLVALSADFPVRSVAVSDLTDVDTNYWFATNAVTVRGVVEHMALVNEVDPSYPIILSASGRVMDGMHRVARALLHGEATIRAVQFDVDPEPDYRNCRPEELPY